MTDITKLPDQWREDAVEASEKDMIASGLVVASVLATELEAALPVWTKITDDPDTWPKVDSVSMMHSRTKGTIIKENGVEIYDFFMLEYGDITHWRPLTDLDYPPTEDE